MTVPKSKKHNSGTPIAKDRRVREDENPKTDLGPILEGLMNVHYAKAKFWTGALVTTQVVLYVAGVVAVFVPQVTLTYPPLALLIALITAFFLSKPAKFKSIAESLKRQHEYWQGFDRKPSKGQLADLTVEYSNSLSAEENRLLREGLVFSNAEPLGPRRVVANLRESSWFSKHLAGCWKKILCGVFVVSVSTSIMLLVLTAMSTAEVSSRMAAAKCVSATLTFLLSVGLVRTWLAFEKWSEKASQVEGQAEQALTGTPTEFEAQRLLSEYQLFRASAPLIPTFLWKRKRNALNATWEQLKRE